jgi:hypothetical protein
MLCCFGHFPPTPATWMSMEEIRCASPNSTMPSAMSSTEQTENASQTTSNVWTSAPVRVSLNADVAACASGGEEPVFQYFNPLVTGVVSRIYPSAGPIAGGTEISIWGSAFRDLGSIDGAGGLVCLFGGAESGRSPLQRSQAVLLPRHDQSSGVVRNATENKTTDSSLFVARCISPRIDLHYEGNGGGSVNEGVEIQRAGLPLALPLRLAMNGDIEAAVRVPPPGGEHVEFTYFEL